MKTTNDRKPYFYTEMQSLQSERNAYLKITTLALASFAFSAYCTCADLSAKAILPKRNLAIKAIWTIVCVVIGIYALKKALSAQIKALKIEQDLLGPWYRKSNMPTVELSSKITEDQVAKDLARNFEIKITENGNQTTYMSKGQSDRQDYAESAAAEISQRLKNHNHEEILFNHCQQGGFVVPSAFLTYATGHTFSAHSPTTKINLDENTLNLSAKWEENGPDIANPYKAKTKIEVLPDSQTEIISCGFKLNHRPVLNVTATVGFDASVKNLTTDADHLTTLCRKTLQLASSLFPKCQAPAA